jgi:hypothetical protein
MTKLDGMCVEQGQKGAGNRSRHRFGIKKKEKTTDGA